MDKSTVHTICRLEGELKQGSELKIVPIGFKTFSLYSKYVASASTSYKPSLMPATQSNVR